MKQYIDKSEIIAEIERRRDKNQQVCTPEGSGAFYEDGFILDIINSLDTLEVKEVDLDKEIDEWIAEGYSPVDTPEIAKHFFELGLKAKGE